MKDTWIELDSKTTIKLSQVGVLLKDINGGAMLVVQGHKCKSPFSYEQTKNLLKTGKIPSIGTNQNQSKNPIKRKTTKNK